MLYIKSLYIKSLFSLALLSLAGALILRQTGSQADTNASPPKRDERILVRANHPGNDGIHLSDGRRLTIAYSGPAGSKNDLEQGRARPLALASADFDEDGVPDLVSGYAGAKSGIITLMRGNLDALYPNGPEAQRRRAQGAYTEDAFLSPARVFDLKGAPDFIATGDFDADGHWDVATAERGGNSFFLLRGNGAGDLSLTEEIHLPGRVTTTAYGEINRADGLTDLVVAVVKDGAAQALVFEGPSGALRTAPEAIALPAEARSLAVGRLDGDFLNDLAIASGRELIIVRGRDGQSAARPAKSYRRSFPFSIRSITIGNFDDDEHADVALLSDAGSIHLVRERTKRRTRGNPSPEYRAELFASGQWPTGSRLVCAGVSAAPTDSLLLLDSATTQLHILSADAAGGRQTSSKPERVVATSLDVEGGAEAVFPMRLNSDALSDLVVLSKNQIATAILKTAPSATFTVTTTDDEGPGSLRQAILDANSSPGFDSIEFNIPGGGPYVITPFFLPSITESLIMDGTTQPGFAGTPIIELQGINGNSERALSITAGKTVIRGLVISGFDGAAVVLTASGNNTIEGNYIGTDVTGTISLRNFREGIAVQVSSNNIIGGTTVEARNVVSASGISGNGNIRIVSSTANRVQGNYIGTNAAGTAPLDSRRGLTITAASGNTIGGTVAGSGNLISSNQGNGVDIFGASDNLIQGNLIGTNNDASAALPNGGQGIFLFQSANNLIGGTTPTARNIISGNLSNGIHIRGVNNQIKGNFIGTNQLCISTIGNTVAGVLIEASFGNQIGGMENGSANVIAFNSVGIRSSDFGDLTLNNPLHRNSIFSNADLGIDTGPDGPTPNDDCDADFVTTHIQNFPVLSSAVSNGSGTMIQGTLNSSANRSFTLEFFANSDCDGSGFGQGKTFLGSTTVTTDGSCNASFSVTFPAASNGFITATATNPFGNTSEFSECRQIICLNSISPTSGFFDEAGGEGSFNLFAPGGCDWAAVANAPWIVITSAEGGSGNGIITFLIRENTGDAARQGAIECTGATFNIVQRGRESNNCNLSLSPMAASYAAGGGSGSIALTTGAGCAWQAATSADWISITSSSIGIGPGTITYSVAPNATPSTRRATIIIGEQLFSIKQKGS